jgi:hypothetical protein
LPVYITFGRCATPDPENFLAARLPYLLSFITGQSDPRRHALSPEQSAFLTALPAPEENKLWRNFPWRDETPEHRETPLLPASYNNLSQFFAAQRKSFAIRHRADLEAWASRAEKHLVFAGSCGMELLRRLDPPADLWPRLHVFAYGPVWPVKPPCKVFAVLGRRDWIARPLYGKADAMVEANHLDYLEVPEVLGLAKRFVQQAIGR